MTQNHFQTTLQKFQESVDEVEGVALISREGVMIESTLPSSFDHETLATIALSTINVGAESVQKLGKGQIQRILLKNKDGFVVLQSIPKKAILFVLCSKDSQPSSIISLVENTAKEIHGLFN